MPFCAGVSSTLRCVPMESPQLLPVSSSPQLLPPVPGCCSGLSFAAQRQNGDHSLGSQPNEWTCLRYRLCRFLCFRYAVLLLPVTDGCPDGIFRQHRAVNLHRRQSEFLHNVSVLDLERFRNGLTFYPLRCERR